ncbi:MAG: LysE family translocator [Rhodoglobus sp.]|nr:LysE family translocator [Rhodoglobus sp.]
MVPLANLVAFALVAIPIILLPGPSVLFVIGRSLSLGRIGGLLSVSGNAAGALVVVVAVAFGVGIIIAESAILFTAIKIVGAGYLIYLGVQAIRHRRDRADAATAPVRPTSKARLLVQGFLVGVSNPKTIVFFIAVLPQFVDYGAGAIPSQMLLLGFLFVAIALLTDSAWALAAGFARDWFAKSPRRISTLGATGGVMMIGLGTASLFIGHGKD